MTKAITPKIGKKIAKEVSTGIIDGAITGGVYGLGEGLLNDENPVLSSLEGIAIGGITGGTIGLGAGTITKSIVKKDLIKNTKNNRIKLSNEYYKNFERGVKTYRDDLGEIILSSDSFKETTRQSPQNSIGVIDLSNNIRNAKYLYPEPPEHNHKYKIIRFHRLAGKDFNYLIAENSKGKFYFYKVVEK